MPPCWINQRSWGCNCCAEVKAVRADNEHWLQGCQNPGRKKWEVQRPKCLQHSFKSPHRKRGHTVFTLNKDQYTYTNITYDLVVANTDMFWQLHCAQFKNANWSKITFAFRIFSSSLNYFACFFYMLSDMHSYVTSVYYVGIWFIFFHPRWAYKRWR